VKGCLVLRIRLPYFTNGKLRLTGNTLAVGTVTAIGIPRAMFMLVGGALTDHSRRAIDDQLQLSAHDADGSGRMLLGFISRWNGLHLELLSCARCLFYHHT